MANFAAISYDMQTLDDDFQTLSPDHRHVWLALLATRWPKCGIFKGGISPLANATGRDRDVILEALATFERLGWIFREGEYIWIRSWIRHRSQNANWLTGALKEARELVPFTPLAQRCLDEYAVDTPSRHRVDAVLQYSTVQNITEQQSTDNPLRRNGKPSRVRPDRPSLSELESALAPECMPAWCQWKAVLAGANKTGSVSEQRLAICLEHILTIAEQEQLTKAALSYGLCAGAAKGFKKRYQQPENYALAAARSYEPPDNRPDAEYYAGSPEHQRLKTERLPDEIR